LRDGAAVIQEKDAGLVIKSAAHGKTVTVTLAGQDITRMLRDVKIHMPCAGVVEATLEYIGAVTVIADDATVTLQQSEICVTCSECDGTTRGERQQALIVDATPLGSKYRLKALAEPVSA
jgi:hypothetical protein